MDKLNFAHVLIENFGVNPNAPGGVSGKTAVMYAISNDLLPVEQRVILINYLLSLDVDVSRHKDRSGKTAFDYAVYTNEYKIISALQQSKQMVSTNTEGASKKIVVSDNYISIIGTSSTSEGTQAIKIPSGWM